MILRLADQGHHGPLVLSRLRNLVDCPDNSMPLLSDSFKSHFSKCHEDFNVQWKSS